MRGETETTKVGCLKIALVLKVSSNTDLGTNGIDLGIEIFSKHS